MITDSSNLLSTLKVLWIIPCKPGSPLDLISARRGVDLLAQNGIEVFQFDFHSSRSIIGFFKDLRNVRNICKQNKIDYVHAQFGSTTALFALLLGVPYFVTFRGTDLNGDPDSYFLSNLCRKFFGILSAYFSQGVVVVSEPLTRHLIKTHNQIVVIPSGTEDDLFFPVDSQSCRKELSLSFSKYYIAFASGGGRSLKRPDLARKIVDSLRSYGYDVEMLEIWKTPHEDVPKILNASNLVILTSDREGSPNIVREAMACGIPVISFDVGDVRRWITLDNVSSIVKFGDTDSMVRNARFIFENPPKHLRRVDIDLFSVRSSIRRLAELYRSFK